MKRLLILLAIGAGVVAVAAVVVLLRHGGWQLFALVNGVAAAALVAIVALPLMGADEDRPPGAARVSAARWAIPGDPDALRRGEAACEPEGVGTVDERMSVFSSTRALLVVAVPPAAAAVLALVFGG